MENNLKRLNKFIGETGHCSRREADTIIEAGRVTVNGKPAELGMKVSFEDEVRIDGKLIVEKTGEFVYLALNKPPGIECTTNTDVKDNIIDFLNYPKRIFPIGRLDKASEGLIFLTDDGEIVNKILRARNNHEKEYEVTVDQPVSERFIEKMSKGVPILDTVTRECFVEATGKFTFTIILTQGLNRQIRRMCEYLGYEVVKLKRTRIINIKLDLPLGRHRELSKDEIDQLNLLIEPSSKTEEASFSKEEFKGEKPKRDFAKKDFQKKDFQKRDFSRGEREARTGDAPQRDFQKRDFQNNDFRRGDSDQNPERKRDFSKKDFKSADFRPKTDGERNYDSREKPRRDDDFKKPDSFRPAPKRNIEIIKKDDPRYRKEGDA
ncbi:23S rRNA pseudouridine(2604) synthase RluF [Flavobacterium sp. D33]|nr:23S rRNA pseudouridine(2604) synthase RluF [Flavobacterium selenitireducens]MBD3582449.1 23S rRNA pseudouridine(2604) synthase RluF [Flavobacterium selenitireducens]